MEGWLNSVIRAVQHLSEKVACIGGPLKRENSIKIYREFKRENPLRVGGSQKTDWVRPCLLGLIPQMVSAGSQDVQLSIDLAMIAMEMTVEELVRRINIENTDVDVDVATMGQWCQGEKLPGGRMLQKLEKALDGVQLTVLLTREGQGMDPKYMYKRNGGKHIVGKH